MKIYKMAAAAAIAACMMTTSAFASVASTQSGSSEAASATQQEVTQKDSLQTNSPKDTVQSGRRTFRDMAGSKEKVPAQTLLAAGNRQAGLKRLDSLVEAGTITQEQADTVQKAFASALDDAQKEWKAKMEEKRAAMKEKMDAMMAAMEEKKAAKEAAGKKEAVWQNAPVSMLKEVLDGLVSEGTITQEQVDAIQAALKAAAEKKMEERKAAMEEKKAAMEAAGEEGTAGKYAPSTLMKEVLDRLVAEGTLSQEQSDAILKLFPANEFPANNKINFPAGKAAMMNGKLHWGHPRAVKPGSGSQSSGSQPSDSQS